MSDNEKQIILCILDGWGVAEDHEGNAITKAFTPTWDSLLKTYPNCLLNASGEDVGLPANQMGNSEVGHLTIGAGRTINQSLQKINLDIINKTFEQHSELNKILNLTNINNGTCHLFGILSDGGIHGHIEHLIYFAKFIAKLNLKICLHLFLDGRDTDQSSSYDFLKYLEEQIKNYKNIEISSVCGRFYAMDRDNNWERTYSYFDAIYNKKCDHQVDDFKLYISENYQNNIFDEFIPPAIHKSYSGIANNDSIFFTNFRADRIIQLCSIFAYEKSHLHKVNLGINFTGRIMLTEYSDDLKVNFTALIKKENINNNLGEIISKLGFKQNRIAETEKFAHVTYFFNGGLKNPYPNEERCLIPSIKTKSLTDFPEMRTKEIASKAIESIQKKQYKFTLVNFAAPDMLGHTGNLEAAIRAVECIDKELGKLVNAAIANNVTVVITADHGNCENMLNKGQVCTSHTNNPVPFIIIDNNYDKKYTKLKNGSLRDIAPTILKLVNINTPKEMQGQSLINI